jgi:hypothetical protein
MSKEDDNIENIFANFVKQEGLQNVLMNLTSQMSSHLINCDLFNQVLHANPNITDQLITDQINLFKKDHPNSTDIINKYLQPYQEKRSDKFVYQIRQFLKSGDCKQALDDPQVQQYLNEILNSSQFKEKFQRLLSQNLNKYFFSSQ